MMILEPLQMPENVKVDDTSFSSTYGKFEIGPLEPGFATTIGNNLRRILLSSIQGAAVRYVKVEGLHHEFAPIPGTNADYMDVILRLKKLVVKMDSVAEQKLVLEHKGKGMVTAADFQESADVTIINKDLELLEVVEDIDFRMEIWVGIGRGYVPAELHPIEDQAVGVIPVDSIYTPIPKVNFFAGNQRVGDRIDFDKLTMEVYSDGSIDPKDALFLSAKILKDMYAKIALFDVEPEYLEEVEMDPELERLDKLFNMEVKEMELTVRSSNCLAAAKIETIGELVSKNESEMLKYRNFGKKSLDEISQNLTNYELHLGMDVDGIRAKIAEAKTRVTTRKKG